jgi:hypothetical protein
VSRVHILVEGQTEEAVVERVLRPLLEDRGVWVTYSILTTKRSAAGQKYRGGVSTWSKIEREVRNLLGDTSLDRLTTMIDFYGLPPDAPGLADLPLADPYGRVPTSRRRSRRRWAIPDSSRTSFCTRRKPGCSRTATPSRRGPANPRSRDASQRSWPSAAVPNW